VPIGIPELIIVLVILLVIFGPKRLPGLGRSLGSGMREFKDSIAGNSRDDDDERPALTPATPAASVPTTTAPATTAAATQAAPATPEPAESTVPTERSV
jgi:sec-independent protein translocase protein TatA